MCVVALPGIDRQPTRLYKNLNLPSINPTNMVTLGAGAEGSVAVLIVHTVQRKPIFLITLLETT